MVIGCVDFNRVNPSFAVSMTEAQRDLSALKEKQLPLKRPVVIVRGYMDPGLGPWLVAGRIRCVNGTGQTVYVAMPIWSDMDACRRLVVEAVEKCFPSDDPNFTTEVDAVGLSLGGVVCRYAASNIAPKKATGRGPSA